MQSLFESIIIARLLGLKALAAYSICLAPVFFIGILRSSICNGTLTDYVNTVSCGDKHGARLTFTTGLFLTLLCGILSVLAFFFLMPPYLSGMGLSPEIYNHASLFLKCYLPVLFLRPLNEFFGRLVICDGGTKNGIWAFNTAFFVIPISELILCGHIGIGGIGIGQTIGRTLNLLILLLHFLSARCSLKVVWEMNLRFVLSIFKQGLPMGGCYFSTSMNIEFFNRAILYFSGDAYLPFVPIFLNLYQLADLGMGAAYSTIPLVGSYWSEQNARGVRKTLRLAIGYMATLGACITLVVEFFPQIVVWMVGIESGTAFHAEMCRYTQILALFVVPISVTRVFMIYYLTVGKFFLAVISPIVFSLICFSSMLPVTYPIWGMAGLAWGMAISAWCIIPAFCLGMRLFGRYKWHEIPFLLPERATDKNILMFNLYLVPQQINAVVENADKAMKRHNISHFVRSRSKIVLREAMTLIREQNRNTDILAECTLNMNGDSVSVTLKDTGVVFDITSESLSTKTFHTYIMGCLMTTQSDKRNQFIGGFNCNCFSWEKDAQSDATKA